MLSGGHHFLSYSDVATPPWIAYSYANNENGWTIDVANRQPGANGINVRVIAYCAS